MAGYQLKITIKGSKPPIWRRVVVPERITFSDLDEIIEALFGWTHSHLYEFYIPEEQIHILEEPTNGNDMEASCAIDSWMQEKRKIQYIYDFGDWWEHEILVEKIMPYEERYPLVLKFKGPNLMEDCGGIWGFYEYIEEAEPFSMEEVNEKFKLYMEIPEAEASQEDVRDGKMVSFPGVEDGFREEEMEEFLDFLKNGYGRLKGDYGQATYEEDGDILLEQVFADYSKDNLTTMAKAHGFTRYSKFNKREMVQWLKNSLLETVYMKKMLGRADGEEIELVEQAMKGPILCPEERIAHSLFLSSYGAYTGEGILRIPFDVREKFKKIYTGSFREEQERKHLIKTYCDGAWYLYGVISIEELTGIYNHYEEIKATEDDIEKRCRELDGNGLWTVFNGFLIDEELLEEDMYKDVLEEQEGIAYYLPETKEEFLEYGRKQGDGPNEYEDSLCDFMAEQLQVEFMDGARILYEIQMMIRNNYDAEEMLQVFDDYGYRVKGAKQRRELQVILEKLRIHTRCWSHRGHTEAERMRIGTNIIPFRAEKKIYPNDPCPCGSGKKYKHCCGKEKK